MNKQIGLSVVIKPEHMDIAAMLYQRGMSKDEARMAIREGLGRTIRGKEAIRKTADALIRIWFSNDNKAMKDAIKRDLDTMDMRLANKRYLELLCATYPFLKDVVTMAERQKKMEDGIDNKRIEEWMVGRWGDFPRVRYSVVKAMRIYRYFTIGRE